MNLLVTDFDGVLCDSVWESLLSAFNAYCKLKNPGFTRLTSLESIPSEQQRKFRRLRAYLHGVEDFNTLIRATLSDEDVLTEKEFLTFSEPVHEKREEWKTSFYAERDYLRLKETEIWLQLNPLFQKVTEEFRRLEPFTNVFILTTKRQQDVEDILRYSDIDFPLDHIHAVSTPMKYQRLMDIVEMAGYELKNTVYVEDQINFLPPARSAGSQVYLAEWGYISPEHREKARKHSISIISEAEYAQIIRTIQSSS